MTTALLGISFVLHILSKTMFIICKQTKISILHNTNYTQKDVNPVTCSCHYFHQNSALVKALNESFPEQFWRVAPRQIHVRTATHTRSL